MQLTGHTLKDCWALLNEAWESVTIDTEKAARLHLRNTIEEAAHYLCSKAESKNDYNYNERSIEVLGLKLLQKVGAAGSVNMLARDGFESLRILLSGYDSSISYIKLGKAFEYFNQAIPLYSKLSGLSEDKLKWEKSTAKNKKASKSNTLINGDIMKVIERDCPTATITASPNTYADYVAGKIKQPSIAIAATRSGYIANCIDTRFGTNSSIACYRIPDTIYGLAVWSNKTRKWLSIKSYNDVKRALNK